MSKSTDEFKKMMESDRGEREIYASAELNAEVFLPLTRDGFEALVARAAGFVGLEVTGPIRNIAVGFLHSLGRTVDKTTIGGIAAAIRNSLSSNVTYGIDQEVKAEANKELHEEQEKARKAAEEIAKAEKIAAAQAKREQKTAKKSGKPLPVASKGATHAGKQ